MHLVGYFPPERLGGVGEFVAALHGGLRDAGHTSLVVTTGAQSSGDVRRISPRPLGWFLKSALWLRRARDFDVVHCQSGEAVLLLLLLRLDRLAPWSWGRKRPRILATFHVHYVGMAAAFKPYRLGDRVFAQGRGPWIYRNVVSWAHRVVDGLTVRLADAVNMISRQSAVDVLGERKAGEAWVIYYGLPRLADLPATAGDKDKDGEIEPVEILYAGTGGHRKRIAALPYVLEAVRRQVPDARLRILGFTPEAEPEVAQLFEEKGLSAHVDFAGVKTSAELPPYYARADVLVVPSAYEGLPLVILEAMRSGLPVVATRVSGHPEAIVDGENGFLVELDRPDEMAERCIEILSDKGFRRRLGDGARQTFADRFTVDRQVRDYLDLYARLTGADRLTSESPT